VDMAICVQCFWVADASRVCPLQRVKFGFHEDFRVERFPLKAAGDASLILMTVTRMRHTAAVVGVVWMVARREKFGRTFDVPAITFPSLSKQKNLILTVMRDACKTGPATISGHWRVRGDAYILVM